MSMVSYQKKYIAYKSRVDKRLGRCMSKQEPVSLCEPVSYILSGGGKRIRPLLVLLACEGVGGTVEQGLPAAVAIEILHNFSLVHDDIMDHASTRRGRLTVHKKWGESVAILTGDELLGLAYRELLRTKSGAIGRIVEIFTDGVIEVCEGQAYDKEFETRHDVTLLDYLQMIAKKTGKLVSVSLELGAVIGGGSAREVRALREYGTHIGRAFQIQDDYLDIVANEEEFGKRIGGDIVEGKKTYLLLEAYRRARGDDKKLLHAIMMNGGTSRRNVPAVRAIYERHGVLASAQKEVAQSIARADRELKILKPGPAREMLYWFSEMLANRNF
ncbi:MAG: polyprenyl synthetase family protein [Ignavibacteriales bacterium]|nr:polyprenyl synthetase family protein [Ignavibacteriales bacterium]